MLSASSLIVAHLHSQAYFPVSLSSWRQLNKPHSFMTLLLLFHAGQFGQTRCSSLTARKSCSSCQFVHLCCPGTLPHNSPGPTPLHALLSARAPRTLNPVGIPAVSSLEFQLCSLFPSNPPDLPPSSPRFQAWSCAILPGTRCWRSCWRYWATVRRPPALRARWRSRCGPIRVARHWRPGSGNTITMCKAPPPLLFRAPLQPGGIRGRIWTGCLLRGREQRPAPDFASTGKVQISSADKFRW